MLGGEEVADDNMDAKQQMAPSSDGLVTPKKSSNDADGSHVSQHSLTDDTATRSTETLTSNVDQ